MLASLKPDESKAPSPYESVSVIKSAAKSRGVVARKGLTRQEAGRTESQVKDGKKMDIL